MRKSTIFLTLSAIFFPSALLANDQGSFCQDPDALALTDRGSVTDTPCVVPYKKVLVEGGYQYQNLIGGDNLSTFPQTQVNYGLPAKTEIFILTPSYNTLSSGATGWNTTNLGAKAEFISREKWIISGLSYLTLPTGNANFGSPSTGVTMNAIGSYSLNSKLSLSSMLGFSSLVTPVNAEGERFNSFNYSVVLAYAPIEKVSLFTEIFGQTKTAPDQNGGINGDVGLLFAFSKRVVFDVEYSQRLQGAIGGWQNYVGAGLTALLG